MEATPSEVAGTRNGMIAAIRRRRWFLWGTIAIYVPGAVAVIQLTESLNDIGIIFLAWVAVLCLAVGLVAASRCPDCGRHFHMRDSTLSFRGSCRHCGMPLVAKAS